MRARVLTSRPPLPKGLSSAVVISTCRALRLWSRSGLRANICAPLGLTPRSELRCVYAARTATASPGAAAPPPPGSALAPGLSAGVAAPSTPNAPRAPPPASGQRFRGAQSQPSARASPACRAQPARLAPQGDDRPGRLLSACSENSHPLMRACRCIFPPPTRSDPLMEALRHPLSG